MTRWIIILRTSAESGRHEIMTVRNRSAGLCEYRLHHWKVIGRTFLRPSWTRIQAAQALYLYYNPRTLP